MSDTSHNIHALPDCPAWCTTNHQTEIGEPVHWTAPVTVVVCV
jgi:hypothetical protein